MWTILGEPFYGKSSGTRLCVACRCECGKIVDVRCNAAGVPATERCASCVARIQARRIHEDVELRSRGRLSHGHAVGGAKTPTYGTWSNMMDRCYLESDRSFARYGGRGIRVCERWLEFEAFLADMGKRPKGKTLERLNVDGHYQPGNCRLATRKEQGRNKSTNVLLTHDGETLCLSEWAERAGISVQLLRQRISKNWPMAEVLSPPTRKRRPPKP